MDNIIFQIEGGLGKNILSTAVIRAINETYPDTKITVVTAYPDIWRCNPRIDKAIQFGKTDYFYKENIKNKNVEVFLHDPYRSNDYILGKKHLTEIWCDLCKVEWKGEKPELYFTELEFEFVKTYVNKTDRPIFMIQPFGGSENQSHKYSWARDITPGIAQEIVNHMSKNYRVIQISRPDQMILEGVELLKDLSTRQLILAMILSDKRLFIDSFMQHAAAALELKSEVIWIVNDPKVLGYTLHNNLVTNFEVGDLRNSLYQPFDILGDPIQLATSINKLFDSKAIIEQIESQD